MGPPSQSSSSVGPPPAASPQLRNIYKLPHNKVSAQLFQEIQGTWAREAARSYSQIVPTADFAECECGSQGVVGRRLVPWVYISLKTSAYDTRAAWFVQKTCFALLVTCFVSENWGRTTAGQAGTGP